MIFLMRIFQDNFIVGYTVGESEGVEEKFAAALRFMLEGLFFHL